MPRNGNCRTLLRWWYSGSQTVLMLRLDGTVVAFHSEKERNFCDLTGCWACNTCSIPMIEACPRSCRQGGRPGFWRQQDYLSWCWALDCALCSASKVAMAAARLKCMELS